MEKDSEKIMENYMDSAEEIDDGIKVGDADANDAVAESPKKDHLKKAAPKRNVEDPDVRTLDAGVFSKSQGMQSAVNNPGWIDIHPDLLPSLGLFYPAGTRILIKAASGAEIKYWSTLDDENVISVDDMLDYIVEKCCLVRTPDGKGNWRDLKSVDRLYIILAVRELTFPDGINELKVMGKDGKDVVVTKEMVGQFVVPEELRDYYDAQLRCFVFPYETFSINVYMPSVGVNKWLKSYVTKKVQENSPYDESFIGYAPLLISDYRYLDDKSYERMVSESDRFGAEQWSLISMVEDLLKKGSSVNLKYTDESGVAQEAPFNFRGGIKSIFLFSSPLSRLAKN